MGSGGSKKTKEPNKVQTPQAVASKQATSTSNENQAKTNTADVKKPETQKTDDAIANKPSTDSKEVKQKSTKDEQEKDEEESDSEEDDNYPKRPDVVPVNLPEESARTELYEDWHTANLTELMGDLELQNNPHIWEKYVDSLINTKVNKVVPEKERKQWKTVRLFVSSTFKDMGNERDYLVKKVFPQLRQWCEGRKLRLIECDLRWGVPKDADTRETLMACLSEIDRCREENVHPYFLNLMSERYGWVPNIEEIPEEIRAKYKWMPGMSVTASEIMVGGYWDKNKHALFMFRTPEYLDQMKDKKGWVEVEEEKKQSLSMLKSKIQDHYPDQTHQYSCKYENEDNGMVKLGGFNAMGERVLNHFKTMLEYQYPTDSLGLEPTTSEVLRTEHETFMFQRSQVLLGRENEVKEVSDYIESGEKSQVPLVLVGFPGSGKSALMAYTVKNCVKNEKYKVFYHFIGATPGSTDLFSILQRFFLEFMPEGTKMPEDLTDMKRYAKTMFEYAAKIAVKEGYKKIVVFIDALNQMDDDGDAHYLLWLPRQLPEGMRVVVSTLEGKCLDSLRNHQDNQKQALEMMVNPLNKDIRKQIAIKLLLEYNKRLDDEQLEILTSKPDAGRPLWLTIACEELRVFGQFRQLTQKVKDLPGEIFGLLEMVLQRIVKEYGGDLVQATLCLIEMSRFGLLETELLDLLARQPTCPGSKNDPSLSFEGRLPMAKWALVYVGLRQFLRPCGSSGEGRLDFHHRTISKVVRKLYLMDDKKKVWWHDRLTEYFETCSDIERKAEELPYHLECSCNKENLKQALLEQDMFNQMYKDNNKQQLMKYWRFIGGYDIAATCYIISLEEYIKKNNMTDVMVSAPIQSRVASFLSDIGEYTAANDLLEAIIKQMQDKGGDDKPLVEPLNLIVKLNYKKALTYVYSSNPGYKECCRLGRKYSNYLIQVSQKHLEKDKRQFGYILMTCGYFEGENTLQKAQQLFESVNEQQGMAQVYYMLGEKNQYKDDLNIPINLFTMSMSLCLSMFGRFSLHTARCAQLYGQMYWNNWNPNFKSSYMEKCLDMYKEEVEILSEVQGPLHPNTVRSREDVIIILDTLKRPKDADVYRAQQPKEHNAL